MVAVQNGVRASHYSGNATSKVALVSRRRNFYFLLLQTNYLGSLNNFSALYRLWSVEWYNGDVIDELKGT
jgi:hypothetical protein